MNRQPATRNILPGALLAAALLAGCATAPGPLRGEFAALAPTDATRPEAVGAIVRWGGTIAAVEPQKDRTCFQVVGHALDASSRPLADDRSVGRFLACRAGFYDPQVFAEGREITISGRIDGEETRLIGEYEYRHPRVAADVIYLWPPRREIDMVVHDPWYPYPWYGPWRRPWRW